MVYRWLFVALAACGMGSQAREVVVAHVPPSLNGALTKHMFEAAVAYPFDGKVEWVGKEYAPTPFYRRRIAAWKRAGIPERTKWDVVYLKANHLRFNIKTNARMGVNLHQILLADGRMASSTDWASAPAHDYGCVVPAWFEDAVLAVDVTDAVERLLAGRDEVLAFRFADAEEQKIARGEVVARQLRDIELAFVRRETPPAAAGRDLAIRFDDIDAPTDVQKLLKLPDMIASRQQNTGYKYSLGGIRPQPAWMNTMVRVVFSARVHNFKNVAEPVDMGSGFAFYGEGRPIFECGRQGLIRFSQWMTAIESIAFVGPKDNVPPLLFYGKGQGTHRLGESAKWEPSGVMVPGQTKARGILHDAGKVVIRHCIFKGLGIAMRTRKTQATDPGQLIIADSTFMHVDQISDRLLFDGLILRDSWVCPTIKSDRAVLVNLATLYVVNVLFVPCAEKQREPIKNPLKNLRWIDNHGPVLDIRNCRFGNESVNFGNEWLGEQISIVYNYRTYDTTWINPPKTVELYRDPTRISIRNNWMYCRNVPVIKFFEIPNHLTITGNTGLNGWYKMLTGEDAGKVIDNTVWCWFSPEARMPGRGDGRFFSYMIHNNVRRLKVTLDDPLYLPEPLCRFGPVYQGLRTEDTQGLEKAAR